MKQITNKLIITTMLLAIMHAGCCCACVASDGMRISAPKVPDMRLPDDVSKALIHQQAQPQQEQTQEQTATPTPPDEQQAQPYAQTAEQPEGRALVQQPSSPEEMERRITQQALPVAPQEGQNGFMSAVLDMLSALVKVILLIFMITGIYIAYKKLKPQLLHAAIPKNGDNQTAPATVSEAVASYARHKLREH